MGNKILYIEGDPDNIILVRRALEFRGYKLLSAMKGIEGVEIAEKEELDLILLNIKLPDIDGYEVIHRIRVNKKKQSLHSIPLIAITINDTEKALAAGCDVCMARPIDINDLWARVESFVPPPPSL